MKETMVKQTVKVNPDEEHSGISENFFLTEPSKQK